jgi:porphobilinogen synthase
MPLSLVRRPRRLRRNQSIRDLNSGTQLQLRHLVEPLFVTDQKNSKIPILSLPGLHRESLDHLLQHIDESYGLGLRSFALFPAIDDKLKTSNAEEAYNPQGLIPTAVKLIKSKYPEAVVITDVALDPYSDQGHDGLVKDGKILNDESILILCKMAVAQARSGADFVAPSDMMDGRIGAIREALDENGFTETGIISYTAKYASSFYGPFREALNSAPKFGDKKTYQMDFRNSAEALVEAELDYLEGADIMMVKPGLAYLDIIYKLKEHFSIPIAAYNVSGEYAMVKAAAEKNMIDGKKVTLEILQSFVRAGADMIFTYHAQEAARWLDENK